MVINANSCTYRNEYNIKIIDFEFNLIKQWRQVNNHFQHYKLKIVNEIGKKNFIYKKVKHVIRIPTLSLLPHCKVVSHITIKIGKRYFARIDHENR